MNVNEVIKKPILSEKTYAQMENQVYTFAVDNRTNKIEVKKVVEYIFQVKVARVNIIKVPKKAKKVGKYSGFTSSYKKAIVKLSEGKINIFPEEIKNDKKDFKKESKKILKNNKIKDVKDVKDVKEKKVNKIDLKVNKIEKNKKESK